MMLMLIITEPYHTARWTVTIPYSAVQAMSISGKAVAITPLMVCDHARMPTVVETDTSSQGVKTCPNRIS